MKTGKNIDSGASFAKEIIHKLQNISLSSQAKLYLALSSIPASDIVFQSIEGNGFHLWETAGLTGITGAIGGYINRLLKKSKDDIQHCLEESQEQAKQFKINIENFEVLLKNIPGIGFFVMEGDTYKIVNETFARMTGKEISEITGSTDKEIFPLLPDDLRDRLLASNQDSLKNIEDNINQETLEETISLPLKDGEHILMIKKSPYIENGKKYIIGVAIDITDLIRQQLLLEEQKQLAEDLVKKTEETANLKTAFLANMSHELRTPLNAIIGFSELILTQQDQNKQIKYQHVERIKKSGYDLLSLIDDTLDMAKINAGMFRLVESRVSLQELIDQVTENQDHSINKNPNVLILKHESIENIDTYVLSDGMRIKQVLNNLIGNAIKFTDTGRITISCPKIEDIGEHQKIYLSVQDTGIGIAEDKIDVVFDRFRQVDNSSTRQYAGSGLGLSLAKEISQHMGGDITVESTLGKGSTFTFSFVVKKQQKEDSEQQNVDIENHVYHPSK